MAEIDNSWIKPGAEVVIYRDSWRDRNPDPRLTTVARVAAKSFTVEGTEIRIKLETLKSAEQGDSWNHWRYVAVRPDSEVAARLFEARHLRNLRLRAQQAASDWNTGPSRDDPARVDAVIAAFQNYRAALGIAAKQAYPLLRWWPNPAEPNVRETVGALVDANADTAAREVAAAVLEVLADSWNAERRDISLPADARTLAAITVSVNKLRKLAAEIRESPCP